MTAIRRDPAGIAKQHYEVVVIGGGIYGCCLTLEAARRGMRVLLLERDDFGGATSWNSLRIIHGGLRYLQNADLGRFRRSVREQSWWLQHFPDLVQTLPCMMPLYNRGLRRTSLMRLALIANDWMASSIRHADAGIPPSRILTPGETIDRFPMVNTANLRGAARWHDARMTSPPRLLMEVLRWASEAGADAINYMSCEGLQRRSDRVVGATARCQLTNEIHSFSARHVVNCGGPWARDIAAQASANIHDDPGLALAFNILVDRIPLSEHALAVTPPHPQGATYFLVPCGSQTLIGTMHLPLQSHAAPTPQQIDTFLNELNRAITGINLRRGQIQQVLPGLLPAHRQGSPSPGKSPRIIHHGKRDGNEGLTTVLGVKYTTARHIAEKTLRGICRLNGEKLPPYGPTPRPCLPPHHRLSAEAGDPSSRTTARDLQKWMDEESVVHLDDWVLRRHDPLDAPLVQRIQQAKRIMALLDWPLDRQQTELARLTHGFQSDA